jgi:hypothetical protein
MRTAVTLARRHGATKWELLSGPEVPLREQQEAFKAIRMQPVHADLAEVSFREDGASARNYRLATAAQAQASAEAKAKAQAAAPPVVETSKQPIKSKTK